LHDNGIVIQFFVGIQNFEIVGFLCFSTESILLFGQSILTTVAIQTALNSFLGYISLFWAFPKTAKNRKYIIGKNCDFFKFIFDFFIKDSKVAFLAKFIQLIVNKIYDNSAEHACLIAR